MRSLQHYQGNSPVSVGMLEKGPFDFLKDTQFLDSYDLRGCRS